MEEIDVVKKGSMAWLWIVLAIAAVALLVWMMMGGGNPAPRTGLLLGPAFEPAAVVALVTG
jgi:bacteriorhodopsin